MACTKWFRICGTNLVSQICRASGCIGLETKIAMSILSICQKMKQFGKLKPFWTVLLFKRSPLNFKARRSMKQLYVLLPSLDKMLTCSNSCIGFSCRSPLFIILLGGDTVRVPRFRLKIETMHLEPNILTSIIPSVVCLESKPIRIWTALGQ